MIKPIKIDILAGIRSDGVVDWVSIGYDIRNTTCEEAIAVLRKALTIPGLEAIKQNINEAASSSIPRRSMFP